MVTTRGVPAGVVVLTDRRSAARPLRDVVAAAVDGGAGWVVLRETDLRYAERHALAEALRALLPPGRLIVAGPDPLGGDAIHLPATTPLPAAALRPFSRKSAGRRVSDTPLTLKSSGSAALPSPLPSRPGLGPPRPELGAPRPESGPGRGREPGSAGGLGREPGSAGGLGWQPGSMGGRGGGPGQTHEGRYEGVRLVGRSCHGRDELGRLSTEDYVTLSPIYPTATKPGYGPALGAGGAARLQPTVPWLALGGVDSAARTAECVAAGAVGVAVLGAVMRAEDPAGAVRAIAAGLAA